MIADELKHSGHDGAIKTSQGTSVDATGEVDFQRIFLALRRHWLVIVLTIGMIIVIGQQIITHLTPRYSASASILLAVKGTEMPLLDSVSGGFTPDAALIRSQIDIIYSRSLAKRVVNQLDLIKDPEFNFLLIAPESSLVERIGLLSYLPENWQARFITWTDLPLIDQDMIDNLVVSRILNSLTVLNEEKSYTITLHFVSEDPVKAARIVNAFAEGYVSIQIKNKKDTLERAAAIFDARSSQLRERVTEADQAVQEYREKNNIVNIGSNTLVNDELERINTQFLEVQARRLRAQTAVQEWSRLSNENDRQAAARQFGASPLLISLFQQEAQIKTEIAELRTAYRPQHPSIVNLAAKLGEVQARVNAEIGRVLNTLVAEVQLTQAQERELEQKVATATQANKVGDRANIELRQLLNEADSARSVHQSFLNTAGQIAAQADLTEPGARILSQAEPPLWPIFPQTRILLGVTVVTAILLALGIVLMLELLDSSYRLPEDVERNLGVPVLGLLPALRRRGLRPSVPAAEIVRDPLCEYAEAIRSVRTTIRSLTSQRRCKMILVTSAVAHEGKTSFAVSFGRLMAVSGLRILLIDGDLRRPTVGRTLGATDAPSITDLLGRDLNDTNLEDFIRTDQQTGMNFIPCTKQVKFPAELLGSRRMEHLLKEVISTYDLVIVDSPPVSVVSDALALAPVADITILVNRWGKTPRNVLHMTVLRLTSAGADIGGVIMSHVSLRRFVKYGSSWQPHRYGREYYARGFGA
jgi:polysaccharide biosynthesis transport protein